MIINQLKKANQFTATELQLAQYILQHPSLILNLSLKELSKISYTSEASIIRLCKKVGYKGYSEFKIQLAKELSSLSDNQEQISKEIPISEYTSTEEIADDFYQLSVQTLQLVKQSLDYSLIYNVASLLHSSSQIHLFGRGESLVIAQDFHYKLLRLGLNSSLEIANGFQEVYSHIPENENSDIAVVISQYLDSRQVQYILDELIHSQTPFVLITAAEDIWPYQKFARYVIQVPIEEKRSKIGSFSSRTAFIYLLDCIYGTLFSLDYDYYSSRITQSMNRKLARKSFYKHEKQ